MSKSKKNIITEVEKRFGVEIGYPSDEHNGDKVMEIWVCKDLWESPESLHNMGDSVTFKWNNIPYEDMISEERFVEKIIVRVDEIKSSSDIYKVSNTGFISHKHPLYKDVNKDIKSGDKIKNVKGRYSSFHPYIYIEKDMKMMYFRMDNPMIGEMFLDTEGLVMKTLGLHPDGKTMGMEENEMDSYFNHRFNEHTEYLEYCSKGMSHKWIEIWFKKCESPETREMLHKDFLEDERG